MPVHTQEQKNEIVSALTTKLKEHDQPLKCPMCGNAHFAIADAYLVNLLQPDLKAISLGGPSIPAAAIICTNCGFISQHAIGVLGLLPKQEEVTHENK